MFLQISNLYSFSVQEASRERQLIWATIKETKPWWLKEESQEGGGEEEGRSPGRGRQEGLQEGQEGRKQR